MNNTENIQAYYVISLCHTMPHEHWVTLWRPDNSGYCYSKEAAGRYAEIQHGYHDSEGNMPIKVEDAEKLFQTAMYDGKEREMIPNHAYLWRLLGVKMTRNGLKRLAIDSTTGKPAIAEEGADK